MDNVLPAALALPAPAAATARQDVKDVTHATWWAATAAAAHALLDCILAILQAKSCLSKAMHCRRTKPLSRTSSRHQDQPQAADFFFLSLAGIEGCRKHRMGWPPSICQTGDPGGLEDSIHNLQAPDVDQALSVAHLVIDPSLLWVLERLEGFIEFLKLVGIATCCS